MSRKVNLGVSQKEAINDLYKKYREDIYQTEEHYEIIDAYLKHFKDDVIRLLDARRDFRDGVELK